MLAFHSEKSGYLDFPKFPVRMAKSMDLLPVNPVVKNPSTFLDIEQKVNRREVADLSVANQNDAVTKVGKSKRRSMTFNVFRKLNQKSSLDGEEKPDNLVEPPRDFEDFLPCREKPKKRKSLLGLGRNHIFAQTREENNRNGDSLNLTNSYMMQPKGLLKTKRSIDEKVASRSGNQWDIRASEDNLKSVLQQGGLNDILKSEALLGMFQSFLVSEFSDENLDFWLAVEYYKTIDTIKRRKNVAHRMHQLFVSDDAERQVNLNFKLCRQIRDGLINCPSDLYDNAQQSIFKLMERDCYKRFLWRVEARLKSRLSERNTK